ncbi:hypothetical protein AWB71_05294 [Caballeronia peredens]|nr:hypothetical protein AWB71_05294 [Caballeronia peredens]
MIFENKYSFSHLRSDETVSQGSTDSITDIVQAVVGRELENQGWDVEVTDRSIAWSSHFRRLPHSPEHLATFLTKFRAEIGFPDEEVLIFKHY